VRLAALEGRTLVPEAPDGWTWPAGEPVPVVDGRAAVDLPARGARLLRAT